MQASISAPTILLCLFLPPLPPTIVELAFCVYYLSTNNPLAITYVLTIYMHLLTYQVPVFLPTYVPAGPTVFSFYYLATNNPLAIYLGTNHLYASTYLVATLFFCLSNYLPTYLPNNWTYSFTG
jgi:hypothetical protein